MSKKRLSCTSHRSANRITVVINLIIIKVKCNHVTAHYLGVHCTYATAAIIQHTLRFQRSYKYVHHTPSSMHARAHIHIQLNRRFNIDSSNTQRSIKWNLFNGALSGLILFALPYECFSFFLLLLFTLSVHQNQIAGSVFVQTSNRTEWILHKRIELFSGSFSHAIFYFTTRKLPIVFISVSTTSFRFYERNKRPILKEKNRIIVVLLLFYLNLLNFNVF